MLRCLLLLAAALRAPALRARTRLPGTELPGVPVRGSSRPMPALGFGTCCRKTARGAPLVNSTKTFLRLGGRLIDTAQTYGNHKNLRQAIAESGVPREELWITSKANTAGHNLTREGVVQAVDDSLQELGLDYLDLMLLHRPAATPEMRAEQWRGLIDAQAAGKVRNIGVSNYEPRMLEGLINATGVTPAVNQINFNPRNARRTRLGARWCLDHGIAVTAYGSVKDTATFDVAAGIAKAHGATPAQVLLRWALDQGVAVIPGATSEEHIRDDLSTSDFRLTPEEALQLENSR